MAKQSDLGVCVDALAGGLAAGQRRQASNRRLAAAQKMGDYKVANCPDQSLAFTNCVFISQSDRGAGDDPVHIELKGKALRVPRFTFPKIEPGCVGLNSVQRRLPSLAQRPDRRRQV